MPELPDIVVYIESLESRIVGQRLQTVRRLSPFVLRTALPPIADAQDKHVLAGRLGKRIVLCLDGDLFLVLHLIIAGRMRWLAPRAKLPAITLAAFDFPTGTLAFTEAGTKMRASLHLARRDQLLPALSDRWHAPRRPFAVPAAEEKLAEESRRRLLTTRCRAGRAGPQSGISASTSLANRSSDSCQPR